MNESGNYAYQYDLKDNLGNNRVEFDKNPTTGAARELQEDEYYAFGLRNNLFGSNNSNRYLYNGKEIQKDLTNQYDYGARFYDPVIARWNTIDPLTEISRRWSPYNYVENNPIRLTDPDGMETYYGDDAVNYIWGLKIAEQTTQQGKDKVRKEAKKAGEDGKIEEQEAKAKRIRRAEFKALKAFAQLAPLYATPIGGEDEEENTASEETESAEVYSSVELATAEVEEGTNFKFPNSVAKYEKHAEEFEVAGKTISEADYVKRAMAMARSGKSPFIFKIKTKGNFILKYNTKTNEFMSITPDGKIQTFFRPTGGLDYFLRQIAKHGKK